LGPDLKRKAGCGPRRRPARRPTRGGLRAGRLRRFDGTDASGLEAENRELRQENERLGEEVEWLQGEVEGKELPEAMPEDFPIPAGAVVDYVSETGYNSSLNFVIDSDFETTTGFYYEQLAARGWEETDRTEGTVEGLEGAETSWERGTFIPEGSPNDPDFAQTKETLTLEVFDSEPSGVAVEVFWTDFEILNKDG